MNCEAQKLYVCGFGKSVHANFLYGKAMADHLHPCHMPSRDRWHVSVSSAGSAFAVHGAPTFIHSWLIIVNIFSMTNTVYKLLTSIYDSTSCLIMTTVYSCNGYILLLFFKCNDDLYGEEFKC